MIPGDEDWHPVEAMKEVDDCGMMMFIESVRLLSLIKHLMSQRVEPSALLWMMNLALEKYRRSGQRSYLKR